MVKRFLSFLNEHVVAGTFNKQVQPVGLDATTKDLIIEGICVNSGYSSNTVEPTTPGGQRTQVLRHMCLDRHALELNLIPTRQCG